MTDSGTGVESAERLSADDTARVLALAGVAAKADGVAALNEATRLRLAHPESGASRHLLVRDGDRVVGYTHLDLDSGGAEGVVDPSVRRTGIGAALASTGQGTTRSAWAHGDHPGAAGLARRLGWERARELWQMRLRMSGGVTLPPASPAAGVTIRAFRPGADDAPWLALNAAAFATHPEQGALTQSGLDQRKSQRWFDPAGFFVAERDGDLVGFHWTKIHADGTGEVYVLGVSPHAQGLGLGKTLTLVGLHHLEQHGVPAVILSVEADNAPAVALYDRLGFTVAATDVMYVRPTR